MTPRRLFILLLLSGLPVLPPAARAAEGAPVILVVGDSISAGYGLVPGQGWVDLLAARLKNEGYRHRSVNASISGDTTAGGKARLPALLARHKPAVVILELGGNDGLRGGNLKSTHDNLDAMVVSAQRAGARVLVLGMKLPPNYGSAYTREFDALFASVAAARKTAFLPFLFDGFGDDNGYFQADRIHPTAAAQPKLLANIWPVLLPLLGKR
jgi:acyl-CoA thioesterase-1